MSNQPNDNDQPGTSEASSSTVDKPNLKRKKPQRDQDPDSDPDSDDDDTDGPVCCSTKNCLSKISKERRARLRSEYREQEEQSSDLGREYLRSRMRHSRVKNPQPTRRSATYQYLIPDSDDGSTGEMVVCQQAFCKVFGISERTVRNARDESCKYTIHV